MPTSWLGSGQPIGSWSVGDPFKIYKQQFSILMEGMGEPDAKQLARLAVGKSVLDYLAKDIAAFQAKLTSTDKQRADAQLSSIRTLEQRLSKALTQTAQCRKPTYQQSTEKYFTHEAGNHLDILDMQLANIEAAFACDITRVATMHIGSRFKNGAMFDPINVANDVHGLSHDAEEDFIRARRVHSEHIRDFALRLKVIPEGSGNMLDNTIIFLGTEISAGHTNRFMPWLTIGGKNMGVRTGYYRVYPPRTPHKRLLISFLNAMGLPDTDYGDKRGPMEHNGAMIDLPPGPLPGYLG